MDKKVVIVFIGVLIAAIFVIWILIINQIYSSPKLCKVISEKEGNKIDVVFFTEKIDKDKVNDYIDYFFSSQPYSNYKEKFNLFYGGEAECDIFEDTLFCYSKDLIKKSGICKNDYIIVLADRPLAVRSSTYINIVSINVNHPKTVLSHEFAHAFATLADEYIPAIIPEGSINCQETCNNFNDVESKFNLELEGCWEGCSDNFHVRSSENSVMRTLATNEYKKLNTYVLEEHINKYN